MFREMMDRVEAVIDAVIRLIPPDFPHAIATPMLVGMRRQCDTGLASIDA